MGDFIGIRVSPETKRILEKWAAASGNRSVSSIIRQLIEEGIENHYKHIPLVADNFRDETQINQVRSNGAQQVLST